MDKFLQRSLRPTVSTVNAKNISSFQVADDVVIVGSILTSDSAIRKRFESIAVDFRDRYTFGIAVPGTKDAPSLECRNNINDETSTLAIGDQDSSSSVAAMEQFIERCAAPLVPELSARNELTYLNAGKSLVHFLAASRSQRRSYAQTVLTLAKNYGEYLIFTTIDAAAYPDMGSGLGIRMAGDDGSGLSVQNPANGDVFPYWGSGRDISAAVVEAFLLDIINGKVKPWDGADGTANGGHDEL